MRFSHDCPYCHHMMELFNITKDVGGVYICRTVNDVGSGQQKFTVRVNGELRLFFLPIIWHSLSGGIFPPLSFQELINYRLT